MFNRVNKRDCASLLPLVLTPQIHFSKSRPTISSELAEVIELQNTAGAEYLQPFLRKRLMAVGEIMNGAHRAVSEAKHNRRLITWFCRRCRSFVFGCCLFFVFVCFCFFFLFFVL